jgi:sulfide:quinone oxidoreductase
MSHEPRAPRHIVVLGGGVAALEVTIALRELAGATTRVTVVSRSDTFSYRPLEIGEPFGLGHPHAYELPALVAGLGGAFVQDAARAVAPGRHEVELVSGARLGYDELVVATGATARPAYDHGLCFDRPHDPESFDELVADLRAGFVTSVAFIVPPGVGWTLPAYELALFTAEWGRDRPGGVEVTILTPEDEPVAIFGGAASAEVGRTLAAAGVHLLTAVEADVVTDATVRAAGGWFSAARVVALPVWEGPGLDGLPSDPAGFLQVDPFGHVLGCPDVLAAGDATAGAIKQGGLAAQQADRIAHGVAGRFGGDPGPPLGPLVLRGLLHTADGPLYMSRALDPEGDAPPEVSRSPLWWPPSKVAAPRLVSHLAEFDAAGTGMPPPGSSTLKA